MFLKRNRFPFIFLVRQKMVSNPRAVTCYTIWHPIPTSFPSPVIIR